MKKFKMKQFVILCALMSVSFGTFAQTEQSQSDEKTSKKGYITNGLWDNWFISLGAGGQVYWGENDREGSFGKRIAPTFDISVGKWITPAIGLRLQYGGFQMKGFDYAAKNPYITGNPDADGLYKQKFNYMNLHGDLLLNLSAAIAGYNPNRVYEFIPYVGFGAAWTFNNNVGNDEELAFNAGIINKFRLSEAFDLNVELKGLVVNQRWDGSVGGRKLEGATAVTVGFTYKFKERGFNKPVQPDYSMYEAQISGLKQNLGQSEDEKKRLADELAREKNRKPEVVNNGKVVSGSMALFFPIGESDLTSKDLINLKYVSEIIKLSPEKKYKIIGSADSKTGTEQFNQVLSEKRAKNVYDTLVQKYGVNPSQVEIIAKGGNSDLSTNEAPLNRVVIVE